MSTKSHDSNYIPMQTREQKSTSLKDKKTPESKTVETTFKPDESKSEDEKNNRYRILSQSASQLRDATVPQTGREHGFVRLLWIIIYFGLFLTFLISFYSIVMKYLSYPTLIEMEIVSRPRLEFPAVTVCNENPVKKSLIGRITDYSDLLILDDYVSSTVKTFAQAAFGENSETEPCPEGKANSVY